MIIRIAAAAWLSLLLAGAAAAQTNTTAPSVATAKTSKASKSASPSLAAAGENTSGHTAAAIDCSRQADAKGLHGQARAKFRSSCKAAAKKR